MTEAFLPGTEPQMCPEHGDPVSGAINKLGSWLKRIIR
jgi:hypothetical protein